MSDPVTVTAGDYTVTSTSEDAASITASLAEPGTEGPDLSKAASDLGKEGGKAAAAKRAEAKEAKAVEAETPDAEGDAQDVEAAPEKPLGKPRDDPRARMLEATRKEAEAKRFAAAAADRAERAERRLAELERAAGPKPQEQPAQRPQAAQGAQNDDPEPNENDFEDWATGQKAIAAWHGRKAARDEFRAQHQQARQRAETEKWTNAIETGMDTYYKAVAGVPYGHPEFKDKFSAALASIDPEVRALRPSWTLARDEPLTPYNVIADEYVIAGEQAPALMMHFTEHPEEYQRVLALPTPQHVQVEMRLIARSLDAAPTATAPPAQVSRAKPPVRPVAGSPHTAETVPGEESSYEDHKRYWTQKDRQAQR